MREVKSMCPLSKRDYLGIDNFALQISKESSDNQRKFQLGRESARIEENRIVFLMSDTELSDLRAIINVLIGPEKSATTKPKAKAKEKVAKAKK